MDDFRTPGEIASEETTSLFHLSARKYMTGLLVTGCPLHRAPSTLISLTLLYVLPLITGLFDPLFAQSFTVVSIDTEVTWVTGASWIDYDNDGDLDLFTSHNDFGGAATFDPGRNRNKLFRNDGADTFTEATPAALFDAVNFSGGQTWADYDNDGDIDLYSPNKNYIYEAFLDTTPEEGSILYSNGGPPTYAFVNIVSGDIQSTNRISAFAAAWADYDNDGFVDLFITTPRPVAFPTGAPLTNVLFDNNRDGTFTQNTDRIIVNGPVDFYTIPAWSDYDQDGDMDLFITNGPIQNGVLQPDYVYRNMLQESGTASFERDLSTNFAAEPRDGQQANWVDYDNDGDLDLYVTNFGGTPGGVPHATSGMVNHLYRNDGDGAYTKITEGDQSTDAHISLGQTWGDFDNDGDLDLYVTNLTSFNSIGGNDYYQNSGFPDYTFRRVAMGTLTLTGRAGWSAPTGDYDNDGDLDLYVTFNTRTGGAAQDALFRNDLNTGAHWINITCVGTTSNRSAIGARVRAKATIGGNTYWQMRELSAQNAATGQSSLRAHFGLGDATVVDSLSIVWPSGQVDTYTNIDADQFLIATEGEGVMGAPVSNEEESVLPDKVQFYANYPNPFTLTTNLLLQLPAPMEISLYVVDALGRTVAILRDAELMGAGRHEIPFKAQNLSPGVYLATLRADDVQKSLKMVLMR